MACCRRRPSRSGKPTPIRGPAAQFPPLLRSLLPFWKKGIAQAPHVGKTGDPDEDLTTVLAMEASMRDLGVRLTVSVLVYANLFAISQVNGTAFQQFVIDSGTLLMDSIGHPELAPRLLQLVFQEGAHLFKYAFVTDKPLSETATLNPNYILDVTKSTTLQTLRQALEHDDGPTALLYRLLNHGTLLVGARDSFDLLIEHGLATVDDRKVKDFNLVAAPSAAVSSAASTVWDKISQPVAAVTGGKSAIDYVLGTALNPANTRVQDYRAALQVLANLPTAELERLLTETLDTASHRIDAWITSLASSRLSSMRERRPAGVHFGAYAWVENLTAKFLTRRHPVTLPDGTVISAQNDSGGFVHAPTLTHAAAAAVLRNAYIGGVGGQQPYEMDLSSAKVRNARWLLDSIRGGQPAGAVFGYLFERGLHDAQLDQYIDKFRAFFPLVFNPAQDAGLATETISARNVVDGLQLRTAWLASSGVFAPGGAATMFPRFCGHSNADQGDGGCHRPGVGSAGGGIGLSTRPDQYIRGIVIARCGDGQRAARSGSSRAAEGRHGTDASRGADSGRERTGFALAWSRHASLSGESLPERVGRAVARRSESNCLHGEPVAAGDRGRSANSAA